MLIWNNITNHLQLTDHLTLFAYPRYGYSFFPLSFTITNQHTWGLPWIPEASRPCYVYMCREDNGGRYQYERVIDVGVGSQREEVLIFLKKGAPIGKQHE